MTAEESEGWSPRDGTRGGGLRGPIVTLALALVSLLAMIVCSGCLALAIPSLAYQGYKYEHSSSQSSKTKQNSSSSKPQSAGQIE
jgi:hypothetical protein